MKDETIDAAIDGDDRAYKNVGDIYDKGSVKQSFDLIEDETVKDLKNYVVVTFDVKANESQQRDLYTALGLYQVREGEMTKWRNMSMY